MDIPYVDIGGQYAEQREEILAAIDGVLKSGQYILGPELEKFESSFAKVCEVKHAIGVGNGTDSLIMLMKALGISEGDEVITAPNSWISSASSIALAGATPVFCDVRADQNMDPNLLESVITSRTKAIMPVHLTGKMADMDPIMSIAKKHNLYVLEDAAQAIDAAYHGKKAGSIGIAASFSLHPLKNLNGAGDGGMITTLDDALAASLKLLRNHGIVDRNDIAHWGFNSRLDSIQAAILNVKIKSLSQITSKRRSNAAHYRAALGKLVECPADAPGSFDVYHLFVIQCDRRDELQNYLKGKGISTGIHYPVPIHLYRCSKYLNYKQGSMPVTESQSKRILSLPVHQGMNDEQLDYVIRAITQFYR